MATENTPDTAAEGICQTYEWMLIVFADLRDQNLLSTTDETNLNQIFRRAVRKMAKRNPVLWRLPSQWNLGEEPSID